MHFKNLKNNDVFKVCDYQSAFEPSATHLCNIFIATLMTRNLVSKTNMKTEILCIHKSPGSGAVRKLTEQKSPSKTVVLRNNQVLGPDDGNIWCMQVCIYLLLCSRPTFWSLSLDLHRNSFQ